MADDISFMQEVEESLRVEKLEQFWQRFGNMVIAGCVGIVVLTSASVVWKNHMREIHTLQTSALMQADTYLGQNKTNEAIDALQPIENQSGNVATLAKLKHAEILLEQKAPDKALALYKEIAADRGNDEALRSLAAAQVIILEANGSGNVDTSATASPPFNGISDEIFALRLIKEGKTKEAREILFRISVNRMLPSTQRARAHEILDTIGEDAK